MGRIRSRAYSRASDQPTQTTEPNKTWGQPAPVGEVIDSMPQENIKNSGAANSSIRDRFAIEDILTSYARAIDRLDIELLKSLYHEDARDDHAWFEGTARD